MSEQQVRGPQVHRAAAVATWEHNHRWGSSFGDSTLLSVRRHDGGAMRIAYGKESIEIRGALVATLAEMVAQAAAWTDAATPHPPEQPVPHAGDGEGRAS